MSDLGTKTEDHYRAFSYVQPALFRQWSTKHECSAFFDKLDACDPTPVLVMSADEQGFCGHDFALG